jgi:hypothetical protein
MHAASCGSGRTEDWSAVSWGGILEGGGAVEERREGYGCTIRVGQGEGDGIAIERG